MRRAALGLAIAAAVLPPSAAAHSLVRPAGSLVSYLSQDATSLNTLTTRLSEGRIEFYDPTVFGGMDPGSCTPGEVTPDANAWIIQTFCPLSGVTRVRIDLGDREDSATVSVPVATTVLAGSGADTVSAGDSSDELSGGDGNDKLAGGGGDDLMSGGQGIDDIDGGPGGDGVSVRDGVRDTVRCGDGADNVDADTLDAVADDCESVTRTETAPPADAGALDDGEPPVVDVGAATLQRVGRSRRVRVFATSSERGTISASGFLEVAGLQLPIRTGREHVQVAGGGAMLTYRLRGGRWRAARRGLARRRRVVVRLGVVATDLAGNSSERSSPRIRLAR